MFKFDILKNYFSSFSFFVKMRATQRETQRSHPQKKSLLKSLNHFFNRKCQY
jgi:hypothetical protein